MKLSKIILAGLLSISSLNAKAIFDLQDQYFENAYKQDSKASLYDLKDLTVSMTGIYQEKSGEYVPKSSGTMTIKLKEKLSDFKITIQSKYYSCEYDYDYPAIVFKANNGKEYIIAFEKDQIIVNGKSFEIKDLGKVNLHISVEKSGDIIKTLINGQTFLKSNIKDFDTLERFQMILARSVDEISDITIYSVK